ncbi:MAG: dTDP-4-amino-4,6-dideoxygalactose transaminase [Bacteroidota bacterium]|nr:dTDP-4-amino-4,6-dideoxygalactose transaminase [Bacteroidota bacterium]MDP4204491.1 dTDP-4-amino-4,6-dideoxygalactose transaminase [Bacteroidota bacterium]
MDLTFIPFNKPYLSGNEIDYIRQAVEKGKISGNGYFTQKCQEFFCRQYGFKKSLLTTSCTDALEMSALLLDIKPGDEIIVPSYTFVSTALAFVRQGAKIIFADSRADHPGIDEQKIEELITPRTRAIVPVHYAGVACDMDALGLLAKKYNLVIIEDAAQAIESYYNSIPLGSIGNLGCFSFHETKNIQCGEGGMLAINDSSYIKRSEIIWEKGTNRAEFFRGEVNKYGWVDIGSSFLPSEINAAFLFSQIEFINQIQERRLQIWDLYRERLNTLPSFSNVRLPFIPDYATNNAHMFYLITGSLDERTGLIQHLKSKNILSVFHYQSLHKSSYYEPFYDGKELPMCDLYTDRLLRLPLFPELTNDQVNMICDEITNYYRS